MEAASIPGTVPIESAERTVRREQSDAAAVAGRLGFGLAAGLVAVLIPGEFGRLSTERLTWRALLGG